MLRNAAREALERRKVYDGEHFWDWTAHVKTRDEEKGAVCAVPQWDFLKRVHREQEDNLHCIWRKPRQMFVSNFNCLKRLYRALCADEKAGRVYFGIMISKREDDAKELMNRVKFMYGTLPDWLKVPIVKQNETELIFQNGGKIMCLPSSSTIGHTYTARDLFIDEFARMPYDRDIYAGLLPTIGSQGRVDVVSTVNGPFNLFAQMWDSEDPYWHKIDLDWFEHPDRDAAWAAREKAKMCPDPNDDALWRQQYLKQFQVFTEKAVYPGFNEHHVDNTIGFVPRETLYRGWDFGGHVAACVFFQYVDRQIRILKELIMTDQNVSKMSSVFHNPDNNIDDFTVAVLDRTRAWFPGAQTRDFCDPAVAHVSDMSTRSQRSKLQVMTEVYGVRPEYRFSNIWEGVEIIRMRLRPRPDGRPGLLISEEGAPVLTTALRGGLTRKPAPPGKSVFITEEINKDGWFEHPHDAFRYAVCGVFRTVEEPKRRSVTVRAIRRDPLTGLPR